MRCDEIPETNSKTCQPVPAWTTTCTRAETYPSLAAMMLADGDPAVAIWRQNAEPECSKCDWGLCSGSTELPWRIVVRGAYFERAPYGLCGCEVLR